MTPRLVQLPATVAVTVTREEHHQDVLAGYRFPEVVAELAWCTIRSGKYRGQRGIEVRLDGRRVGELTHAMSQRYEHVVEAVLAQGNRPGCQARIEYGERGYQLELLMPRANEPVPVAPVVAVVPMHTPQPLPVKEKSSRRSRIWLGVAAVVGLLIVIGALSSPDDKPPADQQAAANLRVTTTTTQAPVVVEPETTTETTETTEKTTTTTKPRPKPPAHTTTRKRVTTTTRKPAPPADDCDPNYSGCVPIASDVDCAGGSGNGPEYVEGPVTVIGRDIYGLDRDHDGIGCE